MREVVFAPTSSGRNGTLQYFIVPTSGRYTITAAGASGSEGNYYGKPEFRSQGGAGAVVSAKFELKKGQKLTILVGQQGECVQATANDGTAGGGGGGSFVFIDIANITDSRYQFIKNGQPFAVLMATAGGGGANDSAYQNKIDNGTIGLCDPLYTLSNYVAPTITASQGNYAGGGIQQYITNNGIGGEYTRAGGKGTGGFGGGGSSDDTRVAGGGWYISNGQGKSFSSGDVVTIENASNTGGGFVVIKQDIPYVWDRTQGDVDTALGLKAIISAKGWGSLTKEQQSLWLNGMKGAWNIEDLNRVEMGTQEIAETLNKYGYSVAVNAKTNWVEGDFLSMPQVNRILQNINRLKAAYVTYINTPTTPTSQQMNKLNYSTANDLERILWDIEKIIKGMTQFFRECGTFQCGENV